jgi:hypothetical protein
MQSSSSTWKFICIFILAGSGFSQKREFFWEQVVDESPELSALLGTMGG